MEFPAGDPDLSPEEAEEKEKREKKKRLAHNAAYKEVHKEEIRAQKAEDYENNREQILAHRAEYYQKNRERILADRTTYYQNNREQILADSAERNQLEEVKAMRSEWTQKVKDEKRFHCAPCEYRTDSNDKLQMHHGSKTHMKAIGLDEASIKAALDKGRTHRCEPCRVGFVAKSNLTAHFKTDKHKKSMRERNQIHT